MSVCFMQFHNRVDINLCYQLKSYTDSPFASGSINWEEGNFGRSSVYDALISSDTVMYVFVFVSY